MRSNSSALVQMSNAELVTEVHRLAGDERQATAALLEALSELDARQLYLDEGCSSLFSYCRDVLGYSEDEACSRMRVARAARHFPLLLHMIGDGSLTLTAARMLAPHLTGDNCRDVLSEARGKTKEQVEILVARLNPKPDAKAMVRKMPDLGLAVARQPALTADDRSVGGRDNNVAGSARTAMSPERRERPVVAPLSPDRYKLQMTISGETRAKVKRAQDLLRHAVPDGNLAEIFDRALTLLIAQAEKTKHAATDRPRRTATDSAACGRGAASSKAARTQSHSRHIPASVKRAVWRRDNGRCTYVGARGRCTETAFLEYHHRRPYCAEGEATVENIALMCKRHNQHEAEKYEEMLVRGMSVSQEDGYPFQNG